MNLEGYGRDVHIPPYIFCLLFKKLEKVQDLYYTAITYTKIKFYIISI